MLELILIDFVFFNSPVIKGIDELTVHESSRLLADKPEEAKKGPEQGDYYQGYHEYSKALQERFAYSDLLHGVAEIYNSAAFLVGIRDVTQRSVEFRQLLDLKRAWPVRMVMVHCTHSVLQRAFPTWPTEATERERLFCDVVGISG